MSDVKSRPSIRACMDCAHWRIIHDDLKHDPHVGACPIKNRLTSYMSLCGSFESKVVSISGLTMEGDRT